MRVRQVARTFAFSTVLTLAAACGGGSPTEPRHTKAVVIEGLPATAALFSTHQLRAVHVTNGAGVDCTAQAVWETTDPAVASVDAGGLLAAKAAGGATVRATCSGMTGAAQVSVSVFLSVFVSADRSSASDPLRVGRTDRVRSFGTAAGGQFGPCTAEEWTSSDPRVAQISPDGTLTKYTVFVTGVTPGEATITATCGGVAGTRRLRVTDGWTVRPFLSEAGIGGELIGTVEVLDGPKAGTVVQGDLAMRLHDMVLPFRVRATAVNYQPTEFMVTMESGRVYEDSNTIEVLIPMRPLPAPPGTEEFTAKLAQHEEAEYRFNVAGSGTFSARVWFALDYNDRMRLTLECGGQQIAATSTFSGGGIEASVRGPYECRLKVRPDIRYPSVTFRLRVSYPH